MRLRRILHYLIVRQDSTSGRDLDHFALLGLPRRFALDSPRLDAAWRELQAKVHPDRFATASDAERRVAMQWASRVNEAYRSLKSPLPRAKYLCELQGAAIEAESNTAMAPAFLAQQMEWHEALDAAREAGTADAYDTLRGDILRARGEVQAEVAALLDGDPPDAHAAVARIREWMFLERLTEQVDDADSD